jgi:hypothetical protein
MHACIDVPACLCFQTSAHVVHRLDIQDIDLRTFRDVGGPMGLGSRTDALDVAGQASPASGAQLVQLGSSLGC